jgi:hypothetical protein
MSNSRQGKDPPDSPGEQRRIDEAVRRLREAYGPEIAARLRPDGRYSIVRIGDSEYAFSDYDAYVAALRAAWTAGLVPDHGPGQVLGTDLPEVAPGLNGVDPDLASTGSPDVDAEG